MAKGTTNKYQVAPQVLYAVGGKKRLKIDNKSVFCKNNFIKFPNPTHSPSGGELWKLKSSFKLFNFQFPAISVVLVQGFSTALSKKHPINFTKRKSKTKSFNRSPGLAYCL